LAPPKGEVPDVTVEMPALAAYDALMRRARRRTGRGGGDRPVARRGALGLMLTELRLPTMRRLAPELCAQSDREGWPAPPAAGGLARARDERARASAASSAIAPSR
jgi:hypothetical protein